MAVTGAHTQLMPPPLLVVPLPEDFGEGEHVLSNQQYWPRLQESVGPHLQLLDARGAVLEREHVLMVGVAAGEGEGEDVAVPKHRQTLTALQPAPLPEVAVLKI